MDNMLKITARMSGLIPVHWYLYESKQLFHTYCKIVFCNCNPDQKKFLGVYYYQSEKNINVTVE
jgi:hypothetical protein